MVKEIIMFQKEGRKAKNSISIFLAGGITNSKSDWRQEIIDKLPDIVKNLPADYTYYIYNPSKAEKADALEVTDKMIKWDIDHIDKADIKVFYFNSDSTQASSMFELGRCIGQLKLIYGNDINKHIFVAIHKDYSHRKKLLLYLKTLLTKDEFETIVTATDYTCPQSIAERLYFKLSWFCDLRRKG